MPKTKNQPHLQDSDSEESNPTPVQTKKNTKIVKPTKKVVDDSEEESSVPIQKNEKKGATQKVQPKKQIKKAPESSEESSEENVPPKNAKVNPKSQISKKKQAEESSEESDAEIIAPKKTAIAPTKKDVKKNKIVAKQESSEESSEEVEKVVKKAINKKPVTKVAKVESESEESESEEQPQKQAPRKASKEIKIQQKKPVKPVDSDEEESEEKPQPRKASKEIKKPIKKVVSSDESEEEEKPIPKKTVKGKVIQKEDSSEEEVPKRKGSTESFSKKINKKVEDPVEEDEEGEFEVAVRGLSYNAYDGDIRSFFEECGNITNVKLLTKPDGGPKGFAFVRFSSKNSFNKALGFNGTEMMGRTIVVEEAKGKSNGGQGGFGNQGQRSFGNNSERPPAVIETPTLYIGGLSYNSTNESIYNFFSEIGQVQSARMVTDKETQQSRGFGYVEFFDVDTAKKAYEQLNGAELDGRRIRLDGAAQRDRTQGGNRNGFGGGNRGGFGGNQNHSGSTGGFAGKKIQL